LRLVSAVINTLDICHNGEGVFCALLTIMQQAGRHRLDTDGWYAKPAGSGLKSAVLGWNKPERGFHG
jgi:hypothetical protein